MKDPRKLLLAIQFWKGDQAQAMKVARLAADLETRHSDLADFLFVSRFDCPHDMETIKYVSRKFNVHHHVSRRRATGWPWGCNELWFETCQYIYEHSIDAKRIPEYKAVLTFEADAFPMCPNWISMLSEEFDALQPAKIIGAMQRYPAPHVNGNALFSCDPKFMHWIARKVTGCAPSGGWDFLLAKHFKEWGWKNSNLFRSWWQTPTLEPERFATLQKEGVAFLHGVKDESVLRLVRDKYLLSVSP